MEQANTKYRIVCNDDPQEETLYFQTKKELLTAIRGWFDDSVGDGYESVSQFQRDRMGIHTIQTRQKNRWVKLKQ
jgi:hypothetical protein